MTDILDARLMTPVLFNDGETAFSVPLMHIGEIHQYVQNENAYVRIFNLNNSSSNNVKMSIQDAVDTVRRTMVTVGINRN